MQHSDCLVRIYNSASSEQQWGDAMDAITDFTGARGSMLITSESGVPDLAPSRLSHHWRVMPPEHLRTMVTNSRHYDQGAWEQMASMPALIQVSDDSVIDAEVLDVRPDIQFLRENLDLRRRVAINLYSSPGYIELLGIQFQESVASLSSTHISAIDLVSPHIAKAAEISRSFSLLERKYRAVLLALDNIHIGVCLVRLGGELILTNREADRILEAKDSIFKTTDNRLACRDSDSSRELKLAINSAMATISNAHSQTEWLITCERKNNLKPLLIEVTPITDGLSEIQRGFQGALVYIIDPENPAPLKIARLAAVCHLTNAEAEVCQLLADGWTNSDMAEERNVSLDTIKTQMSHIFAKTGTRNRNELIRLIVKTSPPVG